MINQLQYISQEMATLTHLEAIERALLAGCQWIQLRVKNKPQKEILETARKAKNLCNQYGARLIINDFPEVAQEIQADGLHLGLTDTPIPIARKIIGKQYLIGGTANTYNDVLQRVQEGADYVGLGPFRFTTTKEKLSPVLGLTGYQTICKQLHEHGINIPVIAIGGITLSDIEPLVQTGIHGIAISGALTQSLNPAEFVKQVQQKLMLNIRRQGLDLKHK
jgi:thiamine-phosphate pyrophosphorylase